MPENSVFQTTYVRICTYMASYSALHYVGVNVQKMSENSSNVHFSGVRFICSPHLSIKSALASFGPIITR